MKKNRQLIVKMTEAEFAQVAAEAARRNITKSELVRRLVNNSYTNARREMELKIR